jgi:hypothetical protein
MTTQDMLDAVNAYADAQAREVNHTSWLALTHRSSRSPEADAARALRDAGREALDVIQDWPEVEVRAAGARVLEAPDGTRVLYYCELRNGRTLERCAVWSTASQIMQDAILAYKEAHGIPVWEDDLVQVSFPGDEKWTAWQTSGAQMAGDPARSEVALYVEGFGAYYGCLEEAVADLGRYFSEESARDDRD